MGIASNRSPKWARCAASTAASSSVAGNGSPSPSNDAALRSRRDVLSAPLPLTPLPRRDDAIELREPRRLRRPPPGDPAERAVSGFEAAETRADDGGGWSMCFSLWWSRAVEPSGGPYDERRGDGSGATDDDDTSTGESAPALESTDDDWCEGPEPRREASTSERADISGRDCERRESICRRRDGSDDDGSVASSSSSSSSSSPAVLGAGIDWRGGPPGAGSEVTRRGVGASGEEAS